jgi:hypothetical protein
MSPTTTERIRDRALAPVASDIPADMTLGEYRRLRTAPPGRWQRARALLTLSR